MDLIQRLHELQGNKAQQDFAAELGISQAMLSAIYKGRRDIGINVLRRLWERCPELKGDILNYALGENFTLVIAK